MIVGDQYLNAHEKLLSKKEYEPDSLPRHVAGSPTHRNS
jgi:hypothetical protein